jgi:pyruvate/2-oxoglutarate dehydrogenase complex dihydrolipoamide dehydrogenase (E3) component
MMPQILGPLDVEMAQYLENDLVKRGVDVITGDAIQEFKEYEKDPESSVLTLKSGRVLPPAQLTILGLGVRPDTKMVQEAGIECTPRGHIVVNEHLQTNAPNVWAVGDAVEVNNPLLPGDKWAVPLVSQSNLNTHTHWNKKNNVLTYTIFVANPADKNQKGWSSKPSR